MKFAQRLCYVALNTCRWLIPPNEMFSAKKYA